MGYKYKFTNSEATYEDTVAFKENLLYELIKFFMHSLPNKRPITITIEANE